MFGFQINRRPKRSPRHRPSPEEIIARQKAKHAVWAEQQLYKLAKADPAIMLQVLSAHLGREIKPTTLEDKLKTQLSERLLDIAIQKLETDSAFARRYLHAIVLQILGMTPEEFAAYSGDGAAGKGTSEKKSALKVLTEQFEDFRRLREASGAGGTSGGSGIGRAVVEFMNSEAMVELAKLLPLIMRGQAASPPETGYAVTLNDEAVIMPAVEYEQMARNGQAPSLLSISKTALVNTAPIAHGDSGAPIPTELAGREDVTDQPNPNAGGMVVKAVDDVVRAKKQSPDSVWQLLIGLDQDIDLVTLSEPDEFVDALRIRADPECSGLLHLLAGMDSEIALEELSSLQEDNKYEVIARRLISPEGHLWLKRAIEEAKNILNDKARDTETKNNGS